MTGWLQVREQEDSDVGEDSVVHFQVAAARCKGMPELLLQDFCVVPIKRVHWSWFERDWMSPMLSTVCIRRDRGDSESWHRIPADLELRRLQLSITALQVPCVAVLRDSGLLEACLIAGYDC